MQSETNQVSVKTCRQTLSLGFIAGDGKAGSHYISGMVTISTNKTLFIFPPGKVYNQVKANILSLSLLFQFYIVIMRLKVV